MRCAPTLALLVSWGCADHTDDEIRARVTLALNHEGAQATAAGERLARYGRRAIPTIESALHTASPAGKKHLIVVLRKIGDPEAIPLLRHLALYDAQPDVRRECESTLRQWAEGKDARAEQSRAAVRAIDEHRATEEAG